MILQNLKNYQVILGSKSPRRQKLLKEIGINFEVMTIEGVNENYPDHLSKEEIPVYLSELKANAFENLIKDDTLLITADTIVWMNNIVIHKPKNKEEAIQILNQLSGTMHQVITGVFIKTLKKTVKFSVSTDVYFTKLNKNEIDYYIETYKPFDKAGSYGIQEFIGYIGIEKIEGSYFNVMGLPIHKLYSELKKF